MFVIPRTSLCGGLLNGGSTAFELLIIPSGKAKFLFCVVGFVCFICLFPNVTSFEFLLACLYVVVCSQPVFSLRGHLDECLVTPNEISREKQTVSSVPSLLLFLLLLLLLFVCFVDWLLGWLVGWLVS